MGPTYNTIADDVSSHTIVQHQARSHKSVTQSLYYAHTTSLCHSIDNLSRTVYPPASKRV
jgi:hypothetical protein